MLATEPPQNVAGLINVAVLAEDVGGGEAVITTHGDVRHLGRDHARIDSAEVGKLGGIGYADERVVAAETQSEFIQ